MNIQRGNPFINGVLYSWSSIEFFANGISIDGVKSINYNDGLDPGKPGGTGPTARGTTLGKHSAGGSIELFRDAFEDLKNTLGPGFYAIFFPVTVSYYEPSLGVVVDTIVPRLVKNDSSNESSSSDGSSIKHDLCIVTPILWNGIPGVPLL